jgi:hypothetical protein
MHHYPWNMEFGSLDAAKAALRKARGWFRVYLSHKFTVEKNTEGLCAYRTRAECDRDTSGCFADKIHVTIKDDQ